MIRVVVADDQEPIREALRTLLDLEPDITVVGEAADGLAAAAVARECEADVVLLDIEMPGSDGIEGLRTLARARPQARALMLSLSDLDAYVYETLRAGASGYLLKSTSSDVLCDAVRAVHSGEILLAPTVLQRLVVTYVDALAAPSAAHRLAGLTAREVDVLGAIGRGMSNSEICAEFHLASSTVKTHVRNLFAKLGIRDRAQAVVMAYETGLVRPGCLQDESHPLG